jgi:hypothetical protein
MMGTLSDVTDLMLALIECSSTRCEGSFSKNQLDTRQALDTWLMMWDDCFSMHLVVDNGLEDLTGNSVLVWEQGQI